MIMDYIDKYDSPLGEMTLASDGRALTGLWFDGQKYFGATFGEINEEIKPAVFDETKRWLDIYFKGEEPDFMPEISMKTAKTTPFRRMVWEVLLTIPYGKTMAYKEIALKIVEKKGISKMSAQAVGGAVAHNPISIIIPCHRVIGSDGGLTGYAGGIEKKIRLLELENTDMGGGGW